MRIKNNAPIEQRSRVVQVASILAALIFTSYFTWRTGDAFLTGQSSVWPKFGEPITYDRLIDPPGFWGTVIFYGFMTMLSGTMALIGIWRVSRALLNNGRSR